VTLLLQLHFVLLDHVHSVSFRGTDEAFLTAQKNYLNRQSLLGTPGNHVLVPQISITYIIRRVGRQNSHFRDQNQNSNNNKSLSMLI
jgi:hypothetical protein